MAKSKDTKDTRLPIMGRPRHYETPEQFEAKVFEYAEFCKSTETPVTWTGLALFLGFSSRQGIDEYMKYPGFSDTVKRAKAFVEMNYECRLHGNSPTGAIFALKQFGWKDTPQVQEGDIPTPVQVVIQAIDARKRK